MRKLFSAAALVAAIASLPSYAVSEGDYYYLSSDSCENDAADVAGDGKLLTVIGNNSQSRVQINLSLLGGYPDDGIQYLENAQSGDQITIVEKASARLQYFSQDTMYIVAKEKMPLKEAMLLPAKLASSQSESVQHMDDVLAFAKKWRLSPEDTIIVQTGARVLVQEATNEVSLKSFFTSFDVVRLEKNLLTIDHFAPLKDKLQSEFPVSANYGACAVKV